MGAAILFYDRGEYARAASLVRESAGIQRKLNNKWALGFALNMLAGIMALAGDADGAARVTAEVMAMPDPQRKQSNIAWRWLIAANVAACRADFQGALAYYERALDLRRGEPPNAVDMQLFQGLAAVRAGQGDPGGAQ